MEKRVIPPSRIDKEDNSNYLPNDQEFTLSHRLNKRMLKAWLLMQSVQDMKVVADDVWMSTRRLHLGGDGRGLQDKQQQIQQYGEGVRVSWLAALYWLGERSQR